MMKSPKCLLLISFMIAWRMMDGAIILEKRIGRLTMGYCSMLVHVIPNDAYVDNNDGINLKLELLKGNGLPVKYFNNAGFDASTRSIYVVPVSDLFDLPAETYILRVTSASDTKDDTFTVEYTSPPPKPVVWFSLTVSVETAGSYSALDPKARFEFMSKLSTFLNDNSYNLQVLTQAPFPKRRPKLTYLNCSQDTTSCPLASIEAITNAISVNGGISSELNNALSPDFQVASYQVEKVKDSVCLPKANAQPFTNDDPLMNFQDSFMVTAYNGTWIIPPIPLPPDLAQDEEDGNLDNLRVELRDDSDLGPAPANFWVEIEGGLIRGAAKSIVMMLMDATWNYPTTYDYTPNHIEKTLWLSVLDSKNAAISFQAFLNVTKFPPSNYYSVEFEFNMFNILGVSYLTQARVFLHRLHQVLRQDYSYLIFVRWFNVTEFFNNNVEAKGVVLWSIAQSSCEFNRIEYIRSVLFSPDTTNILETVNTIFSNPSISPVTFEITAAEEHVFGPCKIEPPTQTEELPRFELRFCGLFRYQIPENAFFDSQDGHSRSLAMQLVDSAGNEPDQTSWIQFDKVTQTLYGILKKSMDVAGLNRSPSYTLIVTDSSKQQLRVPLNLNIVGSSAPITFQISVQFNRDTQITNNSAYTIGERVGQFFGDNGAGFQLVEYTLDETEEMVVFSNCTWRQNPCDAANLNWYQQMTLNDGRFNDKFKSIFSSFVDPRLQFTLFPPCASDESPTLVQRWGPLQVSTCATFLSRVPENTFNDKEQGNTRNLQLEVTTTSGLPLPAGAWVNFDTSLQLLRVVASTASPNINLALIAVDLSGNSWQQTLQINIQKAQQDPSHKVVMKIRQVANKWSTFVDIYNAIRDLFVGFFGDEASSNSFQYLSMTGASGATSQAELTVEWSNCTLSATSCEEDKINYMANRLQTGNQVNPALNNYMSASFQVTSINVVRSGICNEVNEAPTVVNPIPPQTVQLCGYLAYKIPENTFHDSVDGNTPSLALQMTFADGTPIPADYWAYLNPTEQTVYVVISHEEASIKAQSIQQFRVTATNKRGKSIPTSMVIRIAASEKKISYLFQLTFKWYGDPQIPNAYVYYVLINKLTSFYEQTPANMYNYELRRSADGRYIIYKFIQCSFKYEPCDFDAIQALSEKTAAKGRITNELFRYMKPEFRANDFQEFPVGDPCKPPTKPPRYVNPINPITVQQCTAFAISFRKDAFIDEEDGTRLNYLINRIDNLPVNRDSSWIQVFDAEHQFYGVLPNSVNQRSHSYQIGMRAFDTDQTWANGTVRVTINIERNLQSYYQFHIKAKSLQATLGNLKIRYDIATKLNSYFKRNEVNIISFTKAPNTNSFQLVFAPCSLPDHCSPNAIRLFSQKIFTSSNTIVPELSSAFAPNYELESISLQTDPICLGNLNPPIPKFSEKKITPSICGLFTLPLTADTFSDPEDGDATNLDVNLYYLRHQVTTIFGWMFFQTQTNTIAGFPTRLQAMDFNFKQVNLTIMAKDKSGLEGTIRLIIRFSIPPEPKYKYVFEYSTSLQMSLATTALFCNKIAAYQGDASTTHIQLLETTRSNLIYANCSVSYNPCDWAALRSVSKRYSTNVDGIPTAGIVTALSPQFQLDVIESVHEDPCTKTQPQPPKVITPIAKITLMLCSHLSYQIPLNTFYDLEDGDTSKLALAMTVKQGYSFTYRSWLRFQSNTRTITALAFANAVANQPTGGYIFSITARDSTDLLASTDFQIEMVGPYKILQECQIQITVQSQQSLSSVTDFQIVESLVGSLMNYFAVTVDEIGLVSFTRITDTSVMFAFSYCSNIYRQTNYMTNSDTLQVDYYGLATRMLMKIYQPDRKTMQVALQTMQIQVGSAILLITKAETRFTGRCTNLPPVIPPGITDIVINLGFGGYAFSKYQYNYFYDYESGWTFDLKLNIVTSKGEYVTINNWINVDITSRTIYAIVTDLIRFSQFSSYVYYFRATDASGLYAQLKITVNKATETLPIAPFNVTYFMNYQFTTTRIWAFQASEVVNSIQKYFSISTLNFVIVRWYTWTSTSTFIVKWTVARETCDSQILADVRVIANRQGQVTEALKNSMLDMYVVERRYLQTSCNPPPNPPSVVEPIPDLHVQFCMLFVYNLKSYIVLDERDGEMPNLKVELLSSDGTVVPRSSWLQINPGTQQLYAIAIRSVYRRQSAFSYQIRVTNSGGKTTLLPFKVTLENKPFVSDCPITMQFKYMYATHNRPDLDVLWRIVQAISSYYGDTTVRVKVLHFINTNNVFTISWSNCSFEFSTESRAHFGLDQTYRSRITEIFSKVVTSSGEIVPAFMTYMSSIIEIVSLKASYCCIEQPPVAAEAIMRRNAYFCAGFKDTIPAATFTDECDGDTRNLKLSLLDSVTKTPVGINSWLQMDKTTQTVYGVVTEKVRLNNPNGGYKYILVATDYSDRSVNVTYMVNVIDSIKPYPVFFETGFINNYGAQTPTATSLYDFRRRLAAYLTGDEWGKDIYIKDYKYPSRITWSHCSLYPTCTTTRLKEILRLIQVTEYAKTPNSRFVAAMEPYAKPFFTQVQMSENCEPTTTITIIVYPPPINPELPTCGNFTIKIPNYLFSDGQGGETSDFILSMTYQNGTGFSRSSWVQFNPTTQTMYGVSVLNWIPNQVSFVLTANQFQSGATAQSTININYPDLDGIKSLLSSLCLFSMTVESKYNPAYDNAYLVTMFMSTVASYMKSTTSQTQIVEYTITSQFPNVLTIVWTNCSLAYNLLNNNNGQAYYNALLPLLRMFFTNIPQNTLNDQFVNYITSNSQFVLSAVSARGSCSDPPDRPPTVKQQDVIELPRCGSSNYEIPADAFVDEKDGNARNLKLSLLKFNGQPLPADSWIIMNSSQYLLALPRNQTLIDYPTDGYKYLLTATDSADLTSSQVLTVKFANLVRAYYNTPQFQVLVTATTGLSFQYEINRQLLFLQKLESYATLQARQFKAALGETADKNIYQILNCNGYCNAADNLAQLNSIQDELSEFKNHFLQEFTVTSARYAQEDTCDDRETVLDKYNNITKEISYCQAFAYDIAAEFGSGQLPIVFSLIEDFNVAVPTDSWRWYDNKNFSVYAYPKDVYWSDPAYNNTNAYFQFVDSSTGNIIGNPNRLVLKLLPIDISVEALKYQTFISITPNLNQYDAYYIRETLIAIQNVVAEDANIAFSDFGWLSPDHSRFYVAWKICLADISCTSPTVLKINDKLFAADGSPSQVLSDSFPVGFTVESTINNCLNRPPVVTNPELNITIPVCGYFQFTLSNALVIDPEEGDLSKLTGTLLYQGKPVTRSSWILYDSSNTEIQAFPTEIIVKNAVEGGRLFTLSVADKQGKTAEVTLRVFVESDTSPFLRADVTFVSGEPSSTPYLDIQKAVFDSIVLASLGTANKMSQLRVLQFQPIPEQGDEAYQMTYGDCSVAQKICGEKEESINNIKEKFVTDTGDVQPLFKSIAKTKQLDITKFTFESQFTNDEPPTVRRKLSDATLNKCQSIKVCLKDDEGYFITDLEDATGASIVLRLKNVDGSLVEQENWVQLKDWCLYIVPQSETETKDYEYVIEAIDSCNNTVTMPIKVTLTPAEEAGYQIQLYTEMVMNSSDPDVYYLYDLRQKLQSFLQTSSNNVIVHSYQRIGKEMDLVAANCSIPSQPCKREEIDKISSRILTDDNNGPSSEIVTFFSPDITVKNISQTLPSSCSKETISPKGDELLLDNATYCDKVNMQVPEDTFIDAEEGNTRNLKLSLLGEDKQPVSTTNWFQIDPISQTIYGYPRVQPDVAPTQTFTYFLRATNSKGANVDIPLKVNIHGEKPSVDYTMAVSGNLKAFKEPDVRSEMQLIEQVSQFFGTNRLNNVGLARDTTYPYLVKFTWSFCEMRKEPCDCMLINKTKSLLQDRMQTFKAQMESLISVDNTESNVYGQCRNTEPPQVKNSLSSLTLKPGIPFDFDIPSNAFEDNEDGGTDNLMLLLRDNSGREVERSSWTKINNGKVCGLLPLNLSTTVYKETETLEYTLVATDNCGKEATDRFTVILERVTDQLNYKICMVVDRKFDIFENCSRLEEIITRISNYTGEDVDNIIIDRIEKQDDNRTKICWGLLNIDSKNCTNDTITDFSKQFTIGNTIPNKTFADALLPEYPLSFVDDTSCQGPQSFITPKKDEGIPWEILIPILVVFGLLLLAWILWLCIPRFCGSCCSTLCPGCNACCHKSGVCASVDKEDELVPPVVITDPQENTPSEIGSTDPMPMPTPPHGDSDNEKKPSVKSSPDSDRSKVSIPTIPSMESPVKPPTEEKPTQTEGSINLSDSDTDVEIHHHYHINRHETHHYHSHSDHDSDKDKDPDRKSIDSGFSVSPPPTFLIPPLYRPEWYHDRHQETHRYTKTEDSKSTKDVVDSRTHRETHSHTHDQSASTTTEHHHHHHHRRDSHKSHDDQNDVKQNLSLVRLESWTDQRPTSVIDQVTTIHEHGDRTARSSDFRRSITDFHDSYGHTSQDQGYMVEHTSYPTPAVSTSRRGASQIMRRQYSRSSSTGRNGWRALSTYMGDEYREEGNSDPETVTFRLSRSMFRKLMQNGNMKQSRLRRSRSRSRRSKVALTDVDDYSDSGSGREYRVRRSLSRGRRVRSQSVGDLVDGRRSVLYNSRSLESLQAEPDAFYGSSQHAGNSTTRSTTRANVNSNFSFEDNDLNSRLQNSFSGVRRSSNRVMEARNEGQHFTRSQGDDFYDSFA